MADNNNNNNNAADNIADIPPVHRAACMNNVQELKRLIEEEGHSPTSLFGNVRQDGEGRDIWTWAYPLSLAMANGAIKAVTYLLDDCGVSPNTMNPYGSRPIHEVTCYNKIALLRLFLKRGANPNALTLGGASALMFAVKHKRDKALTVLLENEDCDVNIADSRGKTALYRALMKKSGNTSRSSSNMAQDPSLSGSGALNGWMKS
jgi:ankyrin repeat protein